jgi:PAS domain S-box-containing protein
MTTPNVSHRAAVDTERGFRILVHSVKDYGIFMLDPDGYIMTWNEGAERIKGYTAEEIIGKHFSTFYPQEDKDWDKPGWELRVAKAEGRIEDEAWRIKKDGSRFWANVIITALYDENKNLIGFGKVTRDLTERVTAEQRAIQDARKIAEAEAASRAKSEFLTTMSHELRTPLNAIGGYAELLGLGVAGPVTPGMSEYIQRIQNSQKHLLRIINDLLNLGQIEAGKIAYLQEAVDLGSAVSTVVQMVEPQAVRRRHTLETPVCEANVVANADAAKVGQILLNLLSNAVKYIPEGGNISVSCSRAMDMVSVSVEDDGPGIPDNMREAIFEPFVQVGRSLTSTKEGSGLGLAISRELAQAMGGTLTYKTRPEGGSRFTLSLPAKLETPS